VYSERNAFLSLIHILSICFDSAQVLYIYESTKCSNVLFITDQYQKNYWAGYIGRQMLSLQDKRTIRCSLESTIVLILRWKEKMHVVNHLRDNFIPFFLCKFMLSMVLFVFDFNWCGGRRDRMEVGFTTSGAISAYLY
jgi:hypothetical protein